MAQAADGLDDIRAFNFKRGPQCQAGLILAAMDPAIRASVEEALADPTIERAAIVRWLKERKGIVVSVHSFQRHANNECRCE